MGEGDFEITTGGERLVLMPERAAWWPARRTLIVADLHLGKSQALRSVGAAIPGGVLDESLARLTRALRRTGADRLLVLGDLLHAGVGVTEDLVDRVAAWRRGFTGQIAVVPGNHDRAVGRVEEAWGLDVLGDVHAEGGLAFRHDPCASEREDRFEPRRFLWAGHVHPAITLAGGGDRVKLPCFVIGPEFGLMPAFTRFSAGGGSWDDAARVLAVCQERVIEIGRELAACWTRSLASRSPSP